MRLGNWLRRCYWIELCLPQGAMLVARTYAAGRPFRSAARHLLAELAVERAAASGWG